MKNKEKIEQLIGILQYHVSKGDIELVEWKRGELNCGKDLGLSYSFVIKDYKAYEKEQFEEIKSVDMQFLNLAKEK